MLLEDWLQQSQQIALKTEDQGAEIPKGITLKIQEILFVVFAYTLILHLLNNVFVLKVLAATGWCVN